MLTEGIIRVLPARLTPRSRDAINEVDPLASLKFAARFKDVNAGDLAQAVVKGYATSGSDTKWPYVYQRYVKGH
ncbi:hypothetical protein FHW88_000451 [Mucilaginibacter sp. SG538B]|uniref:hypothetical protein n=1 Tax=Mucilaginibacter sp. SG538B TaxID=2587021 RepID=UPI00159D40F8|nr:hypothetical protein [Mucilaginibacter sp. SG538B]NVM62175.1 hypothetical protein [Mucilaginibacter sp. SG538B]